MSAKAHKSKISVHQCLTDVSTPLQIFNTLSHHCTQAVLLESTDADTRLARFSFLAWRPYLSFSVKDGMATLINQHTHEIEVFECQNPWQWMREAQDTWLDENGFTLE